MGDDDVYLHSIFIDSSCEGKCKSEDKYVYPSPSTKTTKTLAPTKHKLTRMEKKKALKEEAEHSNQTLSEANADAIAKDSEKKKRSGFLHFLIRLVYISAGVSVIIFVVRKYAPKPRGSRGHLISDFPRPPTDEFHDEPLGRLGDQFRVNK